jgi:hypothetical protein
MERRLEKGELLKADGQRLPQRHHRCRICPISILP